MSQAKVEQYKKDKANRKKIMKKEKAQRVAGRVCLCAILVAIIGWAGYSGYQYYENSRPTETFYADTSALTDYLASQETQAE